jgi:hypothetical protein
MKKIEYAKIAGLTAGAVVGAMVADVSMLAMVMNNQFMAYAVGGITVGKIALTAVGIGVADYLMK